VCCCRRLAHTHDPALPLAFIPSGKSVATWLLARAHCSGAGALLTSLHIKLNGLAFFQSVKVEVLEAAAVKENFLSFG
jgi:hypothetical protein